jgi:hypothetical protein
MREYYVYVIELKSFGYSKDVYVGSSAFNPKLRFQKHLEGERASRHVKNRGIRLLPEYYDNLNPCFSRRDAKRKELYIRRKLEKRGFKVYGSCTRLEERTCRF